MRFTAIAASTGLLFAGLVASSPAASAGQAPPSVPNIGSAISRTGEVSPPLPPRDIGSAISRTGEVSPPLPPKGIGPAVSPFGVTTEGNKVYAQPGTDKQRLTKPMSPRAAKKRVVQFPHQMLSSMTSAKPCESTWSVPKDTKNYYAWVRSTDNHLMVAVKAKKGLDVTFPDGSLAKDFGSGTNCKVNYGKILPAPYKKVVDPAGRNNAFWAVQDKVSGRKLVNEYHPGGRAITYAPHGTAFKLKGGKLVTFIDHGKAPDKR